MNSDRINALTLLIGTVIFAVGIFMVGYITGVNVEHRRMFVPVFPEVTGR